MAISQKIIKYQNLRQIYIMCFIYIFILVDREVLKDLATASILNYKKTHYFALEVSGNFPLPQDLLHIP